MGKVCIFLVFILSSAVATAFGLGLGDPVESIRSEYGKKIQVDEMYAFGKPLRAGRLDANAKGLFGAAPGANPGVQQFFSGVRKLLPADARMTAAYKKDGQWLKEAYVFKSAALAKVPAIKEVMAYRKDLGNHPVGTCFMIVNYDIDNKGRVANFLIVTGLPEQVDLDDMKKMVKNPFKL